MPASIDHVVIISPDLETAVAQAQTAGFTVVRGGVHANGHTHNALIGFADGAYLELIAPTYRDRTASHRWFERLRDGGGLVDFCLLSADLASEIAPLRDQGMRYSEPFAMARLAPAGARVEWLLSTAPGAVGDTGWPFFIEDITPRALRVPHGAQEITHANGARGVAGITLLVRDLARSTREYESILRTRARAPRSPAGAPRSESILALGAAWIRISAPATPQEADHLARHGQGPYRITLRKSDEPAAAGAETLLDPALFSGAQIALV